MQRSPSCMLVTRSFATAKDVAVQLHIGIIPVHCARAGDQFRRIDDVPRAARDGPGSERAESNCASNPAPPA